MLYLISVSFLWAITFGLVKNQLAGIDPTAVSVMRLGVALTVFLPLLRLKNVPVASRVRLALIGVVQFGGTYLLYLRAITFLQAFEVALFTIFTPLYVVVIDAILERVWHPRFLLAAVFAAGGAAAVLHYAWMSNYYLLGFFLMQGSNLCFAVGQLFWRRERKRLDASVTDAQLFALPYAGAFAITTLVSLFTTDWMGLRLSGSQALSITYLGVVASGLCFFWWNVGAERVNTGTLAVLNNAKVPLGVICSLVIFHERETANLSRVMVSLLLLGIAVWLAEKKSPAKASPRDGQPDAPPSPKT